MQVQHKDVVKNITSAAQLESELQISQAQHGVVVLDVYNAEWGNTKALSETFRLLHTNAGDGVHLRFFSVECTAVMESLQDPDDKKKATAKPKGLQPSPDTLSTFWSSYVSNRIRHSKPYFMFFKEGQFRAQIEGIDTPRITRVVNDLCKQQSPVTDYVTNADLLQFWRRHFSDKESEVPLTRFMHAIREERTGAGLAELTSADISALSSAVEAHGDTVTASGCQSWVGESATVMGRVAELVGAASAPQVNLEPSFVASASAADATSRSSVVAPDAPRSHGSASFSRDLQSWREIKEHPTAAATAHSPSGAAADLAQPEQQPAATAHSPSISQDPQSWRSVHDAVAAPGEQETEREQQPAATAHSPSGAAAELAQPEQQPAATAHSPSGAAAELAQPEQQPAATAHSPSISQDPQSWRSVHDAVAAPGEQETEREQPAQGVELGDNEEEKSQGVPAAQPAEEEALPAEEVEQDAAAASGQPNPRAELGDEEEAVSASPAAAAEQRDEGADLDDNEEGPEAVPPSDAGEKDGDAAEDAPPEPAHGEAVTNQIFVNGQWVHVSDEEMRVWNVVAELPLHYPERQGSMLTAYKGDDVAVFPDSVESMPTLPSYLEARGANAVEVNMMCLAADQKIGSESVSLGKLALVLMSCNEAASQQLLAAGGDYYGEVCDGSLLHKNAPLGYTALCLCASEAYPDEYFFYVPNEEDKACLEGLNEGDEASLAALAPLATQVPEGTFTVRVVGLPKVIELATTDQRDETMILSQWFARLVVAEKSDAGVTLNFIENIANERFEALATAFTARLLEDESHLDKKTGESLNAPELADPEL